MSNEEKNQAESLKKEEINVEALLVGFIRSLLKESQHESPEEA